jgi:hypothetical protein
MIVLASTSERERGVRSDRRAAGQPRRTGHARRSGLTLAIVVQGGVVQGVYAQRCGALMVCLLDCDDLHADDELAEEIVRTGEMPQLPVETGLARAAAEYRAAAARQARLRRSAEFRGPGLNP